MDHVRLNLKSRFQVDGTSKIFISKDDYYKGNLLLAFAGPASNVRVERASRDCFTDGGALAEVMTLYENMGVDSPSDSMQSNELTEHSCQQLVVKILQNNSDGSESGSLLQIMNHTLTIFGSRLLRHWVWSASVPHIPSLIVKFPIVFSLPANIVVSLIVVLVHDTESWMFEEDPDVAIVQPELAYILSLVLTALGRAPDIQRGITRIFHCTATPSEFIAVIQAILSAGKQLQQLNIGEEDNNQLRSNSVKEVNFNCFLCQCYWDNFRGTKKTIRYHPPEVVTALDRLSLAKEELTVACRAAWDSFLRDFSKHYAEFQAAVQALAALDCLHSLAILSRNKGYVHPVLVDDCEPVQIQICSGRHPHHQQNCNVLDGSTPGWVLLTIQQGRSTFLEELCETSQILHRCTGHSLVIIDELGRGTSTHDGMPLLMRHALSSETEKSLVLFVTHYPKIANLRTEFPCSVAAYHVSHLTSHDDARESFGFKVAQLAQIGKGAAWMRRCLIKNKNHTSLWLNHVIVHVKILVELTRNSIQT
ncbi:P-loop containing nucleoside triphosphate hydrolase [Sesbania bispinosa]|nr:P-loop containing nucleoside triphosphate hydrolase [Sesbania bispinosa]